MGAMVGGRLYIIDAVFGTPSSALFMAGLWGELPSCLLRSRRRRNQNNIAPIRARPATGPTTAPAIQAFDVLPSVPPPALLDSVSCGASIVDSGSVEVVVSAVVETVLADRLVVAKVGGKLAEGKHGTCSDLLDSSPLEVVAADNVRYIVLATQPVRMQPIQ